MSEEKLTKQEMFEKDPDQFIHLSELIVAVKVNDEADQPPMTFIGGHHSEIMLRGSVETLKEKTQEMLYHRKMKAQETSKLIKNTTDQFNKKQFRNFIGKK